MIGAIKIGIFVTLLVSGVSQLLARETWWFMQNVNLVFHEAGHVIFFLFGQFLYVLGGTIFEVLIPALIVLSFMRQLAWFSAACCTWWCMTAWLSVSIYASDAQERALPLITGDVASHDWHWLLRQTNLLGADDNIGWIFWTIAALWLLFGVVLLVQDEDVRKLMRAS